jgi:hypothetical protein
MQQNLQRVFCADILVDVAFLFALEAVQHIPAQNVHVAGLGYFVREVLASERTQSRSCHETENGGAGFSDSPIADQIARAGNSTRSPRSNQEQDLRIALEAFAMKKVKPSNIQLLRPTNTLRLVQV